MSTWQEIAEKRRAVEDRLIQRYQDRLFGDGSPIGEDADDRVAMTPWGLGHRFHSGFYITAFRRRSAWPETQVVMDLFWEAHEDRHFVLMKSIWPPDRIHDPGPPHNDLFYVNLWESIVSRASGWLRVQPGPLVYFIWSTPVDLNDPPAPGDPPSALLAARAETAEIKSHWLASP
jgi:hypothetical protein